MEREGSAQQSTLLQGRRGSSFVVLVPIPFSNVSLAVCLLVGWLVGRLYVTAKRRRRRRRMEEKQQVQVHQSKATQQRELPVQFPIYTYTRNPQRSSEVFKCIPLTVVRLRLRLRVRLRRNNAIPIPVRHPSSVERQRFPIIIASRTMELNAREPFRSPLPPPPSRHRSGYAKVTLPYRTACSSPGR